MAGIETAASAAIGAGVAFAAHQSFHEAGERLADDANHAARHEHQAQQLKAMAELAGLMVAGAAIGAVAEKVTSVKSVAGLGIGALGVIARYR